MKNDELRRLPPPPLFTIRPPPKPPGSLFEHFPRVEILNGQCVKTSFNLINNSSSHKNEEQSNWLNLFLLILATISVISCIIIAIFIFICLRKLKKEEKEYKTYAMTSSLSSRNAHQYRIHHPDFCTRTNEHNKCPSNQFNCCDDYYSHQLIPMTESSLPPVKSPQHLLNSTNNNNNNNTMETSQNHQYECIPEYLLTMTRHRHPSVVCHHHRTNTCSVPYTTFSRSLLLSRGVPTTSTSDTSQCTCSPLPSTTIVQEESSTPLLSSAIHRESHPIGEVSMSSSKSMIIGWTRRNTSISNKRKSMGNNGNEQRHSFLSQLRKSSVLQ